MNIGDQHRITLHHEMNHVHYRVVGPNLQLHGPEPYIMMTYLYVRPEDRNKGVAKKLIRKVQKVGEKLNLPVVLGVQAYADEPLSNKQLYRLYSRMGFERTFSSYMRWYPPQANYNSSSRWSFMGVYYEYALQW